MNEYRLSIIVYIDDSKNESVSLSI